MQAKSATWIAAQSAPSAQWTYGLDLLAADEATLLESTTFDTNASDRLVEQSGSITLDVTATTQRTCKLTLRNYDGRYLVGPSGYPSAGPGSPTAQGLTWLSVRYRPWIALRVGTDSSGDAIYDTTYLGMFVLSSPQSDVKATGENTVQLTLADKSILLQDPNLITASSLPTYSRGGVSVGGYAAGSSIDSAMSDLATRAGIPTSKQAFQSSGATFPADFPLSEGVSYWDTLQALATTITHVLYFDHTGTLMRQPNPLLVANSPSVYTVAPGPLCTWAEAQRLSDPSAIYNHVIALGGSSQTATYRGEAWVTDPRSPYHSSKIGERVVYVGRDGKLGDKTPDPTLGSTAQAQTHAQVTLAQHLGMMEQVTLTGRNHPALAPYDRITVNLGQVGLATDMQVQQVSWNLAHDGMQLTASRWVAASYAG